MNSFLWVLYLGVVVTLAGYGLYNYALTKIDASKAAIFVNGIQYNVTQTSGSTGGEPNPQAEETTEQQPLP